MGVEAVEKAADGRQVCADTRGCELDDEDPGEETGGSIDTSDPVIATCERTCDHNKSNTTSAYSTRLRDDLEVAREEAEEVSKESPVCRASPFE